MIITFPDRGVLDNDNVYPWVTYYYGVCGEFGWFGFLVACFLYKTNPNPRKNICCGKKWPKRHF